jgi:hypothetical protein
VLPAVTDIIVAADAPTTEDAVVAAVTAVAAAPTPPTTVELLIFLPIATTPLELDEVAECHGGFASRRIQ